ncbi:hypothetical protein NQ318_000673 [Aromia moschata]|uniref:Mos1 transposase HTH domain-containing protein n=1 Tax=Aromia moschata TaxID=1265417 RepID=A0AAV8XW90_9CUCU|nr:hypothetical protein NQ318_000673 [Aromia moschata]
MQRTIEQRMAIKFCVKLEKSAAETIPMLKKAFGVDCLSDRQIFRWHKAFAEGREYVNDENRTGRRGRISSHQPPVPTISQICITFISGVTPLVEFSKIDF